MEPVRWGILSTAKIGRTKVVPGMMKSPLCRIDAVASRNAESANAMAAEFGIPKAYGSYDELLADPDIEAVYIPLPNHLHVSTTLAAACAGKHVLCEKPIAMTAPEALLLRQANPEVLIAEAFMIRHHPQWLLARDLIRQGDIGTLRSIQVAFSYFNTDPANIRNDLAAGGGGLLDIGCYAIVSGRFLFEADPIRVIGLFDRDPAFGTDRTTSGLLDFGNGRQLSFTVSTQAVPFQTVQAFGTAGRIEIEIPFNAPPSEPTRLYIDDGSQLGGGSRRTLELPVVDQYELQATAFGQAIRSRVPTAYGLDDAIVNMRILDALTRSEESGGWEVP